MSRIVAVVVLAGALVVVGASAAAGSGRAAHPRTTHDLPKEPAESFESFCDEWMAAVETRDLSVEWQADPGGVHGTYVVYGPDYRCTLTDQDPPVGTVRYHEMWYEMRGQTPADAEASTPEAVKSFDTRELFTFLNGEWSY